MGRRSGRAACGDGSSALIVVDTSAWVEYLRATGSPASTALKRALTAEDELGVVDVVRMELLAGAGSDEQVVTVSRLLARGIALSTLSPGDHEYAASLYRAARRSGETVRSMIDCLVTAVAVRLDAPVLARDRDFEVLQQVCPLRLV
jgi:predicted nucleic acid-binding protein